MKMVESKEVLNEQKQQIYENIQKINDIVISYFVTVFCIKSTTLVYG